jgi:hypothetical protein
MEGDVCRMCKRQVFDLTEMSDGERDAFLKSCNGGEVCVSYRLRPALIGAALAAAAVSAPLSAAAQIETVIVGGLRSTKHVEYIETAADRATPVLPVVYDSKEPQAQAAKPKPAINSKPS